MKLTIMTVGLAIAVVLASAGWSFAVQRCPSTRGGQARFRTVAWVNTWCRTDASGFVGRQEVQVQRGDRAPVVVSHVSAGPVPDPDSGRGGPLCRLFAASRDGAQSVAAGFYTGLAVSPDGARVVFEVNDEFSLLEHDPLPDDQKGLFVVTAEGDELVKLAPPAGVPGFRLLTSSTYDANAKTIVFSPDGRYIVYTDLGPGSDGSVDAQLWSLGLRDRKRIQLTHFPRSAERFRRLLSYSFTDADTIGFYTIEYTETGTVQRQEFYSVSLSGKDLRKLSPVIGPNGQVVAQFALTGRRPAVQGLYLEGTAENPTFTTTRPRELFVASGKHDVLQLTHFNRVDVGNLGTVVSRDGGRVFFSASADPFGCNPTNNCQLFSINLAGGGLRQLTRLAEGDRSEDGCFISPPLPGCHARLIAQDRATGSLIFDSSCDPLGTNPAGDQLFAVRPDGSGLRQITRARGVVTDTPEGVEVELPGPFAYQ